jgi:small subunit ribosomal protein S8
MYTDLLTQLRNAQQAKKTTMKIPYSNMDMAVLEVLKKISFIEDVVKKGRAPKRVIEVTLKYEDEKGKIEGVRFISKQSRRLYSGYQSSTFNHRGHETLIVSTPKGVMTSNDARKQKVGGEVLFKIW